MDLDMPNMDGVSATKIIKQNWPDIHVLILTTFQEKEKAIEVLRSGADGYLLLLKYLSFSGNKKIPSPP
jgi:DNA-binding NarL/FixJ family response regulator